MYTLKSRYEGAMRSFMSRWFAVCLLLAAFVLAGCTGREAVKAEEKPFVPITEIPAPAPIAYEMDASRQKSATMATMVRMPMTLPQLQPASPADYNTEGYDRVNENGFLEVLKNPLSTFSIDVDTASYTNVRRFINDGSLPPPDAVRIEEMINYFTYDYPQPSGDAPFSFTTEVMAAPWKSGNRLLLVGLQGVRIPVNKLPPANLVFLIDVSGSMSEENKLPLLVKSFKLLVGQLRQQDRVAIVVYAGQAGLVLPSTSGNEKQKILAALDSLRAGGSTAGGQGIQLAYQVARENYLKEGNNRVILATDGDFNVGASSDADMERLIEERRKDGVFLSVLGYGMGNYKDSKMQKLADRGNGNYAYIDTLLEAKKVLLSQFGGTMMTIAKDVKMQVEFNPAKVKSYRLIGYEKRMLKAEDFADDKKDAGELGSGHTVTALYEIVPAEGAAADKQELTYQTTQVKESALASAELATIRFRYKEPQEETSRELVRKISAVSESLNKASTNIRFAAAVAEWGMLLRNSEYKGSAGYGQILDLARKAKGADAEGYRAEFIRLVEMAELIDARTQTPGVTTDKAIPTIR
ncbi:vWA domain-containing protein [Geomobilimonas luticola]|uniref:von Willebrand factor type A domain-containing protein n=1 Tax=Geomobilimonas luticola TaxID=1114878 RepID=A0ABS5SD13_9BACT|nr:VWA domain-containing protein [Geomobilimonas luticola]MBT0653060.1 von Willebrand factor type A domain-containing protein [Geomobilimonas luticola]